jgi:drug/metabolite transporter (DMT)-like permease
VGAWIVVAAIVVPLVLGCVLLAAKAVGTQRALYLATAVGVLFGLIAVLTKLCTHRVQVGSWRTLLETPALYLLVVLAVVATVLQQSALHAGALPASVPAMLVLEPVAAVLLGAMVLGEQLTARGVGLVALPCALIAMAAATVALGRDSGALDERIAAHP